MAARGEEATNILASTDHRPWPLPSGQWSLRMRWTDLLFAHWPVPAKEIARLLPDRLTLDTWEGSAWVGIVPFRMEGVQLRGLPLIPGTHFFAEANVRTYVREPKSGQSGVYFFSLDASNPLAVLAARGWYHLPYYFARMSIEREDGTHGGYWRYRSKRLFSPLPAELRVRYRGAGQERRLPPSRTGTIEHFLTERYALFTHSKTRLIRSDIHHRQWTLEPAEAQFEAVTLAAAQGIDLPLTPPILHFSQLLEVLAWAPAVIA